MPDDQGRMFAEDVASELGIEIGTWRGYASRGLVPRPAAVILHDSHYRPVWDPADIAKVKEDRRKRKEGNSL